MTLLEDSPWNYPGRATTVPGLLTRDGFRTFAGIDTDDVARTRLSQGGPFGGRTLADVLAEQRRTPVTGRFPLVLVGADADPDRLREKLVAAGREPVVPMLLGVLDGCASAFVAGVHPLGYVPEAVRRAPGERLGVVVALLSRGQLAAVVATKVRVTVRDATGMLTVHGAPWQDRRGAARLYDTDAGVLARDGVPVGFGAQSDALAAWPVEVRELVSRETGLGLHQVTVPRSVMPRLAADPALRFQVRVLLRDLGASVPSGLDDLRPTVGLPVSS
ncbi:hypothetical protein [Luteimicrobium subarcticum]|nr:hypothetical protein [Luteimicrobium subarcticum]